MTSIWENRKFQKFLIFGNNAKIQRYLIYILAERWKIESLIAFIENTKSQ